MPLNLGDPQARQQVAADDGTFSWPWFQWFQTLKQIVVGLQQIGALAIQNGGNAFGAPVKIGSTDLQPVVFVVDGVEVARFEWNGGNPRLLVGVSSSALTTLKGSILSGDTIACVEPGDPLNMAVMDLGLGSSGTADLSSSKKGTGVLRSMRFWIFHTPVAEIDKTTFGFNLLAGVYKVAGIQVVGAQQAAIADAAGGATVDVECRAALNTLLAELRTHGLIAT